MLGPVDRIICNLLLKAGVKKDLKDYETWEQALLTAEDDIVTGRIRSTLYYSLCHKRYNCRVLQRKNDMENRSVKLRIQNQKNDIILI